jgi:hypothetical protein
MLSAATICALYICRWYVLWDLGERGEDTNLDRSVSLRRGFTWMVPGKTASQRRSRVPHWPLSMPDIQDATRGCRSSRPATLGRGPLRQLEHPPRSSGAPAPWATKRGLVCMAKIIPAADGGPGRTLPAPRGKQALGSTGTAFTYSLSTMVRQHRPLALVTAHQTLGSRYPEPSPASAPSFSGVAHFEPERVVDVEGRFLLLRVCATQHGRFRRTERRTTRASLPGRWACQ